MQKKNLNSKYIITEQPVFETNNSALYKARLESESDASDGASLNYLIKEYKGEDAKENSEYEYRMTTEVENDCLRSITIPILEQFEEEGKYYTVRQYRHQGYFLSELISELEEKYGMAKLPFEMICVVMNHILLSLEALHTCENENGSTGYVHMDVHPGNIFLENCRCDYEKHEISIGSAKFIDFQQTLRLDADGIGKRKGGMYYTGGYTAPEVRIPHNHRFGVQSDLYSVAAIGYRMLYGKEKSPYSSYDEEKEGFSSVVNYRLNLFMECGMQSNLNYRYKSAKNMTSAFNDIRNFYQDIKDKNFYESAERVYRLGIPARILLEDEEFICNSNTGDFVKKFTVAVNKLKAAAMSENRDTYRNYYVLKVLLNLADVHMEIIPKRLMFELTANAIRICNNSGNTDEAIELYEGIELPETLDMNMMDTLLSLKNLIAVTYFDKFAADKAMDTLGEIITVLEARRKSIEENINPGDKAIKLEDELLGKAYSAYACYGAYPMLKDRLSKAQVVDYFEKALNEFTYQPFNTRITTRRLQLFAIDEKDRELYEKCAGSIEGFGTDNFNEKFNAVKADAKKHNDYDYALFNYLKAVYTLYMDKVDEDFIENLCATLDETASGKNVNVVQNKKPYHLTYKYAALILYGYVYGEKEISKQLKGELQDKMKEYIHKSLNIVRSGQLGKREPLNSIKVSNYVTQYDFNKLFMPDDEEANRSLVEKLKKHAAQSGWRELEELLDREDNLDSVVFHEKR
jgi:hypothetical protein